MATEPELDSWTESVWTESVAAVERQQLISHYTAVDTKDGALFQLLFRASCFRKTQPHLPIVPLLPTKIKEALPHPQVHLDSTGLMILWDLFISSAMQMNQDTANKHMQKDLALTY